ncbi:MAG: DUF5667 domain-containing protein [Nocardioides sp.]|nr:DUF5667 domain-containing protein [Nocardioides sp.]
MISVIPGHRRADAFATAVAGREGRHDDTHADLLEVVDAMRNLEAPEPRPEFVASLREQLMAEADEALSETGSRLTLPTPTRNGRDRRLALAAGTLVLVAGTGSVAVASQGALPGDTLYPVKRALEGAQTSLTVGDEAKATRALDNANGRLDEIEKLATRFNAESSPETTSEQPETLDEFASQAEEAADLKIEEFEASGDTKPIAQLREFTAAGIDKLGLLDTLLPPQSLEALRGAVQTLTDIDGRAAGLCPGCGGVLELPQNLLNVLRSSQTTPKQGPSNVPGLAALVDRTPVQNGNDHPTLPTVSPDLLGPANHGKGGSDHKPGNGNGNGNGNGATDPGQQPDQDGKKKNQDKKPGKDLQDTLEDGSDKLLGDDGLLSPLNPLLNPLLDPLLGDGGLLDP